MEGPEDRSAMQAFAFSDYEKFLAHQLDELKVQLLAYHNRENGLIQESMSLRATRASILKDQSEISFDQDDLPVPSERQSVIDVVPPDKPTKPISFETSMRAQRTRQTSMRLKKHASDGTEGRRTMFLAKSMTDDLNKRSNARLAWTRFTLKDASRFRQFWMMLVAIMVLYVATLFPFKLAFLDFRIGSFDDESPAWQGVQAVVDVFFWIDLALSFITSYRDDDDVEILDIRLIAKRYLKGMFWLDFLACLPSDVFETLFEFSPGTSNTSPTRTLNITKLNRMWRLLRILRLMRIVRLQQSEWFQAMKRFRGFRMIGLTAGLLWVVHMMACGWYMCAVLHDGSGNRLPELQENWVARRKLPCGQDCMNQVEEGSEPIEPTLLERSPTVQWAHSMYFVLTVFTTVGFGDMSAATIPEIGYVCVLMILGGVVNGMVLSSVMSILSEADRSAVHLNEKIHLLHEFADHTQLNSKMSNRIEMLARQNRGSAEVDCDAVKNIFSSLILPRHVVAELPERLFKGRLMKNYFFTKAQQFWEVSSFPPRLPLFVAASVTLRDFEAGEVVYEHGDSPMNIFLVLSGIFAYTEYLPCKGSEATPYKLFGPRSFFGDYEISTGAYGRVTAARCESEKATALLLNKQRFAELSQDFPAFMVALKVLATRREISRRRTLQKIEYAQNYRQLACTAIVRSLRKYSERAGKKRSRTLS
eukprot:TRINITY_DN44551_c0_g1_i1.p1 TRINITY_DN44551_c0_g1~~TRINITY_DN44551_c0_g1_i1.p1  ORF type:complete len:711 (+),score=84.55 TRINITY_DN44551_c0_g1_i1:27-2135(+)